MNLDLIVSNGLGKWLVDIVDAAKLASTQINGSKVINKLINHDIFTLQSDQLLL